MFDENFSTLFLILAGVSIVLGFLFGMRKKWQLSVIKITNTLLATFVSVFLARLIAFDGSEELVIFFTNVLPADIAVDVNSLLASPAVFNSIKASMAMLLAPILFYLIFILTKLLLGLIKNPIARLWINFCDLSKSWNRNKSNYDKWNKKKLLEHREFKLSSAILGSISGFLLFYVASAPAICGLATMGEIAKPIVENIDHQYAAAAVEFCDGSVDNAGVTAMKFMGGDIMYEQLTSYEVEGNMARAKNEAAFIAKSFNALYMIKQGAENYDGAAVKQSLDDMAAAFNKTTIIPTLLPGIISTVDQKWDNGEAFCGIEKISFGDSISPVTDKVFDIFAETNYNNVKTDFSSGLRIIGIFAENGPIFAQLRDPMALLSDIETNTKVFEAFYSNERFYSIIPAFAECGIDIMSNSIGLHQDAYKHYTDMSAEIVTATNASYNQMMASITGDVLDTSDYETFAAQLAPAIADILKDYGIDANPDSCVDVAHALLKKAFSASVTTDTVCSVLSQNAIEIVNIDGTTISGVTLSFKNYEANTMIVFTDDISVNHDAPANVHYEANQLANAFAVASNLAQSLKAEGVEAKALMVELGYLLDCFDRTHTFGGDLSDNLLICVLQSNQALNALDLDLITVTRLAHDICDSTEGSTYSDVLKNIMITLEVIQNATSSGDITASIEVLIKNLDSTSITALQTVVTPETMQKYGVSADSSEATSDLISNILNNFSNAKENDSLTDEEYEAEAQTVSNIINIAMNATNPDTSDELFGDEGATGVTVTDFIDNVSNSTIMSQTIVDTVYNEQGDVTVDPLNTSANLSSAQKTELIDAMNSQITDITDSDELAEKQQSLIAAAALLNVSVEVDSNGLFVLS